MELDDILVILLAGGVGERLYPLTKERAKPAVYFGGPYRIIDFTLSNCINSGLRHIYIATQYKSLSLNRHIRMGWNVVSEELGEFIEILPPQKRVGEHWYLGTADAVYQNLYSISRESASHIIVLSGDHVYKMDYAKMLRWHQERNADATIATIEVSIADASRFGIVSIDESDRVIGFDEKPQNATAAPGSPDTALASMGIYIFRADVLGRALEEDAARPDSQHDFGKNIIPSLIQSSPVYSYRFYDENKKAAKYCRDIGTLDAYFEASMTQPGEPGVQPLRSRVAAAHLSAAGAAGQVRLRGGRAAMRPGARLDHLGRLHHLGQPGGGQHPLSQRPRAQLLRDRAGDPDARRARRPSRAGAADDCRSRRPDSTRRAHRI
jgi:glucose-1-phosphate adenylyltransferase